MSHSLLSRGREKKQLLRVLCILFTLFSSSGHALAILVCCSSTLSPGPQEAPNLSQRRRLKGQEGKKSSCMYTYFIEMQY